MSEHAHSAASAHHHHHHEHAHGHTHAHGHEHARTMREGGFSLLALSSLGRLALALPPVGVLWLLTLWALHG